MRRMMRLGVSAAMLIGFASCSSTDPGSLITGSAAKASGRANSSLSGNYLAARHASRNRDAASAEVFYARAMDKDPENKNIRLRSFLLAVTSGNMAKASKLAKEVIKDDAANRAARLVLALGEIRAGRYAQARKWLEVKKATSHELASTLLTAWAWQGEGETDKAIKALKLLEATRAFSYFENYHLALVLNFTGKTEETEKRFKAAYDTSGGALRVALNYGNFEERRGNLAAARKIYNEFIKTVSRHPLMLAALKNAGKVKNPPPLLKTPQQGAAEALYGIASQLSSTAGADLAVLYLQLALYVNPDFPMARLLLADIYENRKDPARALSAYNKIDANSPLRMEADIQAALNLDRMNRTNEARRRLKKIIRAHPNELRPRIALGNMLRGRQRYAEAKLSYSRAIEMVKTPDKSHWRLFYNRGICNERIKLWDLAEKDLKMALKLNSEQPLVLNYLGYSWIERKKNLKQAMDMIRKAVDLRPNDGFIIDSLGWAHFQLGEWEDAVKNLERAVELEPDDPVINDHLGDAYWRAGRELEARFQWSHARDMKPQPDVLKKIEAKLKSGLTEPRQKNASTGASDGG